MATYTINFDNNTDSPGNFCIFRRDPNSPNHDGFVLAWLVQFANPHSKLPISWNIPGSEYWVTFGDFQQGQVIDPGEFINPVKIDFPDGIFTMNVTLNMDNTWTITQGQD